MKKIKLQKIKRTISRPHHRVFGLILIVVVLMILSRLWAYKQLQVQTKVLAVPIVDTYRVKPRHRQRDLVILPGTVAAWYDASVYARTNGYVKWWYHDIGDHVKKDELLARIETPELDAQLRQAKADLQKANAKNQIAQITAKRWLNLVKTHSVSEQERDEKVDAAKAAFSDVAAAQANLERLQELVNFEQVRAPFTGVITYRSTDIGKLVNIGSYPAENKPLFRVVKTDPLRIYVKIPEQYATRIIPRMKVTLHFAGYPGRTFPAHLFQTAEAIDPTTRTLLAQFITNNSAHLLLPGSYTDMDFIFPIPKGYVMIPVNTVLFRKEGLRVAVVSRDRRVHLQPITISRDFGNRLEISSGLAANQEIIINPSDSLLEGEQVQCRRSALT